MMILRVMRGIGYTGVAGVGALMLSSPSEVIEGQMEWMTPVWSSMMLAGGILCCWAMVSRMWAGETLGLPFLYSAFPMWGLAYIRQLPYTTGRFALGVVLISIGFLIFAHWREVYKFGNDSINARLYEKRYTNGEH